MRCLLQALRPPAARPAAASRLCRRRSASKLCGHPTDEPLPLLAALLAPLAGPCSAYVCSFYGIPPLLFLRAFPESARQTPCEAAVRRQCTTQAPQPTLARFSVLPFSHAPLFAPRPALRTAAGLAHDMPQAGWHRRGKALCNAS